MLLVFRLIKYSTIKFLTKLYLPAKNLFFLLLSFPLKKKYGKVNNCFELDLGFSSLLLAHLKSFYG